MRSHRSAFHVAVVACLYGVAVIGHLADAAGVVRIYCILAPLVEQLVSGYTVHICNSSGH